MEKETVDIKKLNRFEHRWQNERLDIEWFVSFALPILNAKSVQERILAFNNSLENESAILSIMCMVEEIDEADPCKKAMKESQEFLIRVLKTAFSKSSSLETGDIQRISRSVNQKKLVIWNGKGENVIVDAPIEDQKDIDMVEDIVNGVEAKVIKKIVDLFNSFYNADSLFCQGIGFNRVGMCPNCEIFFEKKRKDQEYCSDRCKKAAKMRRYRAK